MEDKLKQGECTLHVDFADTVSLWNPALEEMANDYDNLNWNV